MLIDRDKEPLKTSPKRDTHAKQTQRKQIKKHRGEAQTVEIFYSA